MCENQKLFLKNCLKIDGYHLVLYESLAKRVFLKFSFPQNAVVLFRQIRSPEVVSNV